MNTSSTPLRSAPSADFSPKSFRRRLILVSFSERVKISASGFGKRQCFWEQGAIKPRHSRLLKSALKHDISTSQLSDLWTPLENQGWRPCVECGSEPCESNY
ncbi:hypothetical protein K1719_018205 [Acacia pycnantha]|nr:hypothetical protein K1719_018205 [Acacia pycnantha]